MAGEEVVLELAVCEVPAELSTNCFSKAKVVEEGE